MGIWVLGVGCWVLGVGCWVLGVGRGVSAKVCGLGPRRNFAFRMRLWKRETVGA